MGVSLALPRPCALGVPTQARLPTLLEGAWEAGTRAEGTSQKAGGILSALSSVVCGQAQMLKQPASICMCWPQRSSSWAGW